MSSSEGAPGSSEGAAAGGDEHAAAAARLLLRADAAQFNTHTLALGLRAAGADAAWCSVFVERCGADTFAESSDLLDGQTPLVSLLLGVRYGGNDPMSAALSIPVLGSIATYTTRRLSDVWDAPVEIVLGTVASAHSPDVPTQGVRLLLRTLLETRQGVDANEPTADGAPLLRRLLSIPAVRRNELQKMVLKHELGRRRLALVAVLMLDPAVRLERLGISPPERCARLRSLHRHRRRDPRSHGVELPALDAEAARLVALRLTLE
jgi:hypothetical protein